MSCILHFCSSLKVHACLNGMHLSGLVQVFPTSLPHPFSFPLFYILGVIILKHTVQVLEFQQRKCSVIFDLSCNLARVLEFCTREIPQAFLTGADTNLRRLTELVVFILNHITSAADAEFFDL